MTNQQTDEITRAILAAIMLKDFAAHSNTSRKMHAALAVEAEARANHLLEI